MQASSHQCCRDIIGQCKSTSIILGIQDDSIPGLRGERRTSLFQNVTITTVEKASIGDIHEWRFEIKRIFNIFLPFKFDPSPCLEVSTTPSTFLPKPSPLFFTLNTNSSQSQSLKLDPFLTIHCLSIFSVLSLWDNPSL
jgi:hypothetical protein